MLVYQRDGSREITGPEINFVTRNVTLPRLMTTTAAPNFVRCPQEVAVFVSESVSG